MHSRTCKDKNTSSSMILPDLSFERSLWFTSISIEIKTDKILLRYRYTTICEHMTTHMHAIKLFFLIQNALLAGSQPPTHSHTNRKKRDRAQLVSLINSNEVRLYYQKW